MVMVMVMVMVIVSEQLYQDKNEDGDEGDGDDSAYHLQVVKPKGSFLVITKAELPSKNVQCVPEH